MDAKGKPPRLRPLRSLRDIFLDDAATPPCGDARRGITCLKHSGHFSQLPRPHPDIMPKRVLEQRLDEIRQLGRQTPTAETLPALKKALEDRHNLVVAQAAKATAELQLKELVPDLLR